MTKISFGQLQYTSRAFNQDAQQAMRGDIIRALIELLTNADDAYTAKGGKIIISIEIDKNDKSILLSVHDTAIGLNQDMLVKCFTKIGEQNEKFNSNSGTRGLFGRGAKDVTAFGKTTFKAIKDGRYNSLEIDPSTSSWKIVADNLDASNKHLLDLRLTGKENGLTATIRLDSTFSLPSNNKLTEKIQNHAQLRDLLNRNDVSLHDERSGQQFLLKWENPLGIELINAELEIEGYKSKAKLIVHRLHKKETGQVNEYSKHGLMIMGSGACYENSFLHLNSKPENGWLFGRLIAPEIDELVREIDKPNYVKTPNNHTRLIDRDRDGLVREHRYYRALCQLLDKQLLPIISKIADEEGALRREGHVLRKKFDSLEKVLGSMLQDLLDESESGELPKSDDIDVPGNTIVIIPPKKIINIDEIVTLSIRIPSTTQLSDLKISSSNENNVEIINKEINKVAWNKHPRLDALTSQVKVKGKQLGYSDIILSSYNVSTKSEILVSNVIIPPLYIPEKLEFLSNQKNLPPLTKRSIVVIAPVINAGEECFLSIDNTLIAIPTKTKMKVDQTGSFAIGRIQITSKSELGTTNLIASMAGQNAICTINIEEPNKNKKPSVKFEFIGSDNPPRRVDTILEDGRLVIRIFGAHRSISRIFGRYINDKFEHETSIQGLVTISEIIAAQVAMYAVERESENHPDRFPDASSVFVRQQERIAALLPSIQSLLIEST